MPIDTPLSAGEPIRQSVAIDDARDVFEARELARQFGAALGMPSADVELVTSAIHMLCECMLADGGRGQLAIESLSREAFRGIGLRARNRRASTATSSLVDCLDERSVTTLRRVMDVFEIKTHGQTGWSLRAEKWRSERAA